jgi:SAM-dependent methyltransferase
VGAVGPPAPQGGRVTALDDLEAYALGRTDAETWRLIRQHQIYGHLTRQFLASAGIGAGMSVLDLGSGAGDVALLLADMVGPRGRVLGLDLNPAILDTARSRTGVAGFTNVTFLAADVQDQALDEEFDAVVGRWFLMHVPDPVAVLRRARDVVRPGGIVAFQESDFTNPPGTIPATDLHQRIVAWTVPPPGAPGADPRIGSKLRRLYQDAGLPAPELRMDTPIGGGPDWPGYRYVAETVRSLLPFLERNGVVTADQIGVDTLEARLRAEVVDAGAVQVLPSVIGAWSRTARHHLPS